jgi:hypothetical protein
MFLKLFYDDCVGNDDVKCPTTPDSACITKQAVAGGHGVVDESEDCGTYTATQPRGNMLTLYPGGLGLSLLFQSIDSFTLC